MRTIALVLLSAIFSAASCLAAEPAAKTERGDGLDGF